MNENGITKYRRANLDEKAMRNLIIPPQNIRSKQKEIIPVPLIDATETSLSTLFSLIIVGFIILIIAANEITSGNERNKKANKDVFL